MSSSDLNPPEPDPDVAPGHGTDQGEAPQLAGEDVRLGPEFTDEPEAGATEPTD